MALSGRDGIGLLAWIRDLTYQEVHAFTWGFGLMFAGLIGQAIDPLLGTPLIGAALVLVARAVYGDRVSEILPARFGLQLPKYVVRQVRQELHYYLSGIVSGTLAGLAVALVIFGGL